MQKSGNGKILILLAALAMVIMGAYWVLTMPDKRSDAEKLGDAVDAIAEGFEKASEQTQDRTLGEKLGATLSDVKEDVKDSIDSTVLHKDGDDAGK
jgi:hypothetical protein